MRVVCSGNTELLIGIQFPGVLVFGIMLTIDGPKLIEYDVRLGDPETQTLVLLLETDLIEIVVACMHQRLARTPAIIKNVSCVAVVLASEGYPSRTSNNQEI